MAISRRPETQTPKRSLGWFSTLSLQFQTLAIVGPNIPDVCGRN